MPDPKDRSNSAALMLALEGVVMTLARAHVAGLDAAGRDTFARDVAANVEAITGEVVTQAPAMRAGNLSPAARKATAARIRDDARELAKAVVADLVGAPAER